MGEQKRKRNKKSRTLYCNSCREIIILDFVQELDVFSFFLQEIFLQKFMKNKKQPFRVKLSHQNIANFSEQTQKVNPTQTSENTKKKNENSRLFHGNNDAHSSRGSSALTRVFPQPSPWRFPLLPRDVAVLAWRDGTFPGPLVARRLW